MDKPVKSGSKKVYSAPVLTKYGTVQALTQKVGLTGNSDHGRRLKIRTHF